MSRLSARTVLQAAIGALAVGAVSVDLPRPWVRDQPLRAGTTALALTTRSDSTIGYADTLHAGETLSGLLDRSGVSGETLARVLRAAIGLDARRAPAGMPVMVRHAADSSVSEVIFELAVDRVLHVRRTGDSTWSGTEERLPWTTDTIAVSGRVTSTLYDAMDAAAAGLLPRESRAELAWTLADVYEYRVDMSRDLQPGDSFRVLVERAVGPHRITRIGSILAARFAVGGSEISAVRYVEDDGRAEFFDATGRSMRSAFLHAPLAFRRISSRFGMRKHPILGIWRQHTGTDYAADAGTPVRAIGDGVVIFAGRKGGYGNALEIRHRNGFVSRYGHLRGYAAGIRPGRSVSIGQTVAYVGMTGLATAPHLHFEILVSGVQRDPRLALASRAGDPVPASERARFETVKAQLLASLDAPARKTDLALK